MPVLPGLLGAPPLNRLTRRSRLLFHWRGRDLSLSPLTGQTPTFSRASAGGGVLDRNGNYYTPVHSQPRFGMVDSDADGTLDTGGLLLEYARTNLALWSSDFSNAAWGGASDFTVASAVSVLPGQVAQKNTNLGTLGSRSRTQNVGLFNAAGDTVAVVIENVNAATSNIILWDNTAGVAVTSGLFTWATRTFTLAGGAGSLFALKVAEVGPNGGPVYLLAVSGVGNTANTRRIAIYPTGTGTNTLAAILHHAQLEGGVVYPSSPIITGAASATRATDRLTYPCGIGTLTPAIDNFTLYARFARPFHADAIGSIVDFPGILSVGSTNPDLRLYFNASDRTYRAVVRDAGGTGSTTLANIPAGAVLEVCAQFKDLAVLPAVAIDVGSGLGAFATGAAPVTAFAGGIYGLGEILGGTHKLGAPLLSAKVASGLFTLDQMRQAS